MTTYKVSRTIQATPEVIWGLLTSASHYPEWNKAVLALTGEISEGNTIKLTSIVNPKREFKLKVSGVEPPTRMVWSDGMPLGLFKGVRTYEVTPNDDGTSCQFKMEEVFSGLMEPLISKSIPDQTESFELFGDCLKAAAESR